MSHTHSHDHAINRQTNRKRLAVAIGTTFVIFLAEVIGGWLTNSLALLSDGGHMLSDLLSLGMAFGAVTLAQRPPNQRRTFGYYRFEILAALANGALLFGVAIYILVEAAGRFGQPEPVDSLPMMIVAVVGLLGNGVAMLALRHHGDSLNTRGAFLHVVSDTLSSVGVIAGGALMALTGWLVIDALISVGIAVVILMGAYRLTREAVSILLESTPKAIPLEDVKMAMQMVSGVQSVHDMHLWAITSGMYALSAHVMVMSHNCGGNDGVLGSLNAQLREKFGIAHATLQIECPACCPTDHCELGHVHDVDNERQLVSS